jgi:hypothetical protein
MSWSCSKETDGGDEAGVRRAGRDGGEVTAASSANRLIWMVTVDPNRIKILWFEEAVKKFTDLPKR